MPLSGDTLIALKQRLAQVEEHVFDDERHIVHQRQIAEELARDGHDTTQAQGLLDVFKAVQAAHVTQRNRLRRELATLIRPRPLLSPDGSSPIPIA